jgi:acyl-CoA thioesterase-1
VTTRGIQAWYRLCWLAGSLAACGGASERAEPATTPENSGIGAPTADLPPTEARRTILLVGTSLTAGLGLDPSEAWSTVLQAKIDSAGFPFRVVNAGVSGETSAGALRRIDWLFGQGPIAVLVVETGANDGLRGLPVDTLRANLDAILTRATALSPKPVVVVAAMEAPPNLGRQYADRFRSVFPELATARGAVLLPFLLDGVAGVEAMNQADGIHPNRAGARRVAENVWRVLGPLLADL